MAFTVRCLKVAASLRKFVPAARRFSAMLLLVDHHNKPHHPITRMFIANFRGQSQGLLINIFGVLLHPTPPKPG